MKTAKDNKEKNKITGSRKSLAFSTISLIIIVAVVAIAVLFNIVFANLVPNNIDMTKNKDFSMGDETKNFLKTVDKEIEIFVLFDEIKKNSGNATNYSEYYVNDIYADNFIQIMKDFGHYGNNITVTFIDPVAEPARMQKLFSKDAEGFEKGDVIVRCGERFKRLTTTDFVYTQIDPTYGQEIPYAFNFDGAIVGAINKVTADKVPLIGIVTDHSSKSIDSFSSFKKSAEDLVFDFEELKIAATSLDDLKKYSILMFIGPKNDLTSDDMNKLDDYLLNGGNAVFMFDSLPTALDSDIVNFNKVLANYNLQINNDLVTESENFSFPGQNNYLIEETVRISGGPLETMDESVILLPNTRSISQLNTTNEYLKMYLMAKTSDKAVSTNYSTEKTTPKAPMPLVAAVESSAGSKPSKIMLAGTTMLMEDNSFGLTANGVKMLTKTLSWMEGTVEAVTISAKLIKQDMATIDASTANTLGIVTVFCIPILISAIGVFVWLRRRHL